MTDAQIWALAGGGILQFIYNVVLLRSVIKLSNKVDNAPSGLYD